MCIMLGYFYFIFLHMYEHPNSFLYKDTLYSVITTTYIFLSVLSQLMRLLSLLRRDSSRRCCCCLVNWLSYN